MKTESSAYSGVIFVLATSKRKKTMSNIAIFPLPNLQGYSQCTEEEQLVWYFYVCKAWLSMPPISQWVTTRHLQKMESIAGFREDQVKEFASIACEEEGKTGRA